MGKTALLVGLVSVVLCSQALAQTSHPVVSPSPTSLPPEKIKTQTFVVGEDNDKSKVCLRVTVAIEVNITYNNSKNENVSVWFPLTNSASVSENSTCNSTTNTASLYIVPDTDDGEMAPYQILFKFTGESKTGDQHWAWGELFFILEDSEILDDYKGGAMGMVQFNTTDSLHGDSNSRIEFTRSYKCDSNQTLRFIDDKEITPFVFVSSLQAQVFKFDNTSGFDNARVCLLDSAGKANKIVPIAVGAALAGLVVVVLIAYLIGRLRSRRQSSYEALS